LERCGSKTKGLYVGKEHVCGLPADPWALANHAGSTPASGGEGWGECGFGWIDGVERTKHSDFMDLDWKVQIAARIEARRQERRSD
jgi:hypothetical protein